jgi:tetratricopeptide (TPR) repeat protein
MQPCHAASALIVTLLLAAPSPLFASQADIEAKYNESTAAMKANKLEDAARLSAEALALAEAELGAENEQTGVLAYNTGVLYSTLGKWDDARGTLEKAFGVYRKVHGEESAKLLPVMNKLAIVYTVQQDAKAGAPLLEQKLAIVSKLHGEKSKEAADVMRDFAVTQTALGKPVAARRMQRRALDIYEDTVGEKSEEVGMLYLGMSINEFSDADQGLGRFETGAKYNRKGVETLEAVYPEGSQQRINLYNGLIERSRPFAGSAQGARTLKELEDKLAEQKRIAADKKRIATDPDAGEATPPVGQ